MKRLFKLKKWHSKTLETWVYPRDQTLRSLQRLLRAVNKEYQAFCKEKAKKMKEEGLPATPVTKYPACEIKESLETATVLSRHDLIEESFSEEVAAKKLFPSEVGDRDAEEPGDQQTHPLQVMF